MKVLLVLLALLVISPFFYLITGLVNNVSTKLFCSSQVLKSYRFCRDKLGRIVYFVGAVGAGKTTMMSAMANVLTDVLIDKAKQKRVEIMDRFPDVDFSLIDSVIKIYVDSDIYNTAIILLKIMELEGFDKIFDGYTDTYTGYYRNYDLLTDYVDATVAIFLDNYVYYLGSRFYSIVTKKYALNYDYDSLKIKDRFISEDYNVMRYKVVLEDEIGVSDSISTNYRQVAADDGGKSLYERLIRHLGKGSNYFFTTSQVFTRAVSEERELATTSFDVYSIKRVSTYSAVKDFYNLIVYFCRFLDGIVCGFLGPDLIKKFHYKGRRIKKFRLWAQRKLEYWNARDFIIYEGIYYTNPGDVGKPVKNCFRHASKFAFCYPIQYPFGSVDTYDFSIVHDFLLLKSTAAGKMKVHKGDPNGEDREKLCQNILKKRTFSTKKKATLEDDEYAVPDDL